jgi:hypothetical protein
MHFTQQHDRLENTLRASSTTSTTARDIGTSRLFELGTPANSLEPEPLEAFSEDVAMDLPPDTLAWITFCLDYTLRLDHTLSAWIILRRENASSGSHSR